MYPVIALPPLAGAENATVICAFPAATVGAAGALGTVLGTAAADAGDATPEPFAFVAVTVHVYDFPFVRPATTIGDAAPDPAPATPPFDDTHAAWYPVIALPPSNGATNDTDTCAFPAPTRGAAGALGTVFGIAIADAGDCAPVPFAFVAATVHVYDFPFESPPITVGDARSDTEPGVPPFDDAHATVYPVIALPPSNGATNATLICAFPAVTVGCAGGSGTRLGTTTSDAGDGALVPFAFVAVSVHVYDFPLVNPTTMIGDPAPDPVPATPPFDDPHAVLYPVIALPPSNGGTNDTVTCPFPAPTTGAAGALGTVFGTAAADAGDAAPAPFAFVAVTVHVYDFPFVRPPTTVGEAVSDTEPGLPPFDEAHAT